MAEEEKTTSAFDRFSKMGAIMGEARLSQEKGMGGFEDYTPNLEDFEKGYDLALKLQKNAKAKVNKNKEATQKLLDQFPSHDPTAASYPSALAPRPSISALLL